MIGPLQIGAVLVFVLMIGLFNCILLARFHYMREFGVAAEQFLCMKLNVEHSNERYSSFLNGVYTAEIDMNTKIS